MSVQMEDPAVAVFIKVWGGESKQICFHPEGCAVRLLDNIRHSLGVLLAFLAVGQHY